MVSNYLYKRNNNDKVLVWYCYVDNYDVIAYHGLLGGKIQEDHYTRIKKDVLTEMKSRVNDKLKSGYIPLKEVVDETGTPPVEDITSPILIAYLERYLPHSLTNSRDNTILAMLAKTYTGNVWKKEPIMFGQPKINGLRCIITARRNDGNLFKPYELKFQSREGVIWNTLGNLEDYLLTVLDESFVIRMIDEDVALDGEVYLPGYTVNEINHFVKDASCPENKLLQYWCYDLAMEDFPQWKRDKIRFNLSTPTCLTCNNEHINNTNRFIILDSIDICSDERAVKARDIYLGCGYEGLILRNPNATYQFGRRRVGYMEKFKTATEGDFEIIDIYKEQKRNLPILLCRNDVNDETFETRLSDSFDVQQSILEEKHRWIGCYVHLHFGERSGIKKVPFHIKDCNFKDIV